MEAVETVTSGNVGHVTVDVNDFIIPRQRSEFKFKTTTTTTTTTTNILMK